MSKSIKWKKIICAQILCYKNQGIHWYPCHPTFLWKINFILVQRLISASIWDISGLWNRSHSWVFREKRIDISRFLALYILMHFFNTIALMKLQLYYDFYKFETSSWLHRGNHSEVVILFLKDQLTIAQPNAKKDLTTN